MLAASSGQTGGARGAIIRAIAALGKAEVE
jgi:hypothetical protein